MSAPGFLTYRQQIEIKADAVSLELRTGDFKVNEEAAHPGLMVSGDVTGDGVVDVYDAKAVIDALESLDSPDGHDPACDLDGDGAVKLVDLEIAAANIGKTQVNATLTRTVSAAAVKATANEGVEVSADPASLLKGEESVIFESKDAISDSNPVVVPLAASGVSRRC